MVIAKVLWNYYVKPSVLLLLIFVFFKALFLWANKSDLAEISREQILQVFSNSLSIDIAVVSYILLLPSLLFFIQLFTKKNYLPAVLRTYYGFVILLVISINLIDIKLFSYWSAKLSAKALFFLNTPLLVLKSAGKWSVFVNLVILVVAGFILFKLLPKLIKKIPLTQLGLKQGIPFFLVLVALQILGLRGGLRTIPINQSDAYFSNHIVLNVAGVNSLWNMGNVFFQNTNSLQDNPYKLLEDEKAKSLFAQSFVQEKDSTHYILNNTKPNIIYIALEGVNANCINAYNSGIDLMPNVSKIMKEGYTFLRMYATGMRTDQGLVSIISGFPAMPLHTICAQPEKFQHLPSFSLALNEEGYNNTFFFAGEPEFGSFKAFLKHNGFAKVYSLKDYSKEQLTQELGAPDEFLFEKFIHDMQAPQEPFFSLLLTQTTHEPFDMPFNDGISDEKTRYNNTVLYVDSLIGLFYEQCKDMPWFENTLFILSSDHSHKMPGEYWYNDKERFRIPFILFGEVLKEEYKGIQTGKIVNQTDIPLSLSKQLNLTQQDYKFSKDIFDYYSPEFSAFCHIHGHDWIKTSSFCAINYAINNDFSKETDSCLLENAAYFQTVFDDYMRY